MLAVGMVSFLMGTPSLASRACKTSQIIMARMNFGAANPKTAIS